MKKILTLLTILALSCCCLFTACGPTGDTGGVSAERQEQANIYKEVAVQALGRMGITLQAQPLSGNTGFALSIPDKKVETTDEDKIENIKFNAKDTAGTMWLLGMLYENSNYVVVNGLAKFDATFNAPASMPDGQIITQTINQYLCLKSNIDKDSGKVYFEAMVTWPQNAPGNYGYTIGEFTYDFSTDTLIDCRYIMTSHNRDFVDMMLMADGSYLWYETETPDEFTLAVDAQMDAFNAECDSIAKLTSKFDAEMQAYVDDLTAAVNNQPSIPPEQPGEGGEGGESGKGEGIGTVTPPNPMQPSYVQVDGAEWNNYLNISQLPNYSIEIMCDMNSVLYSINGSDITVIEKAETTVLSEKYYFIMDGTYHCAINDFSTGNYTEIEVTEDEYNQVRANAMVDYSQMFDYDMFEYDDAINSYYLEECTALNMSYIEIKFTLGALSSISYLQDGTSYHISLYVG